MSDKTARSKKRKPRKPNILVKVSGDEHTNPKFLAWLKGLAGRGWLVIIIGGGSQISAAFAKNGIKTEFGPLGRITKTFRARQLARNVLEENQLRLQDALKREGISASVELPVIYLGTVLCHVNGDIMVQAGYLGFDELYVVTTPERLEKKVAEFTKIETNGSRSRRKRKIEVVAFG